MDTYDVARMRLVKRTAWRGVDPGDATLLLQLLGGLISGASLCGGSGPKQCLDENTNGSVETGDLVVLLNAVAGNPVFQCSDAPPIPCSSTLRASVEHSVTLAGRPRGGA